MNIGHVGNKGGVDRGADRPVRVDGKRDDGAVGATSGSGASSKVGGDGDVDRVSISSTGRGASAKFDGWVEAARADDPERTEHVAKAMQKLMSGELDRDEVYRDVAGKMLQGDFRTI